MEKEQKFTSELTRHFNAYKDQIYPKSSNDIQLDYYNKKDIMDNNLEDCEGDLLGKTNHNIVANDITEMLIEYMP